MQYSIREIHYNTWEIHLNRCENDFNLWFTLLHENKAFTAMCYFTAIRKEIRKPVLEMNQAGSHFTN